MNFSELSLHPPLRQALSDHNYETATPVQTLVLEPRCQDRDLLVSARTGSGKTVAFGLAFGASLLGDTGTLPRAHTPLALVIAPTRELALQVQGELQWLYAPALAQIRSCVGGMDVRREAKLLAEGAHVVVGTPGRLCDHLARGRLDLSQLRVVVLDEADEMLDMGFREELETLLNAAPSERRTLLFSATLPHGIEELAARYQREPLRIAADSPREAHADIDHRACLIAPRERDLAVVNLLRHHDPKGALVFCSTREAVSRLQANLSERGFLATAISGELTQAERTRALKLLRDGHARVLVATDVAARGLDLPHLDLVIHADPPRDAQALQHRSGRTGRAGRKGISVLLVPWRLRAAAERQFRQTGIPVRWFPVPTLDEIHALDRERLGQEVIHICGEVGPEELAIAQLLLEELRPDQLAAALVRQCYARLPIAEDLPETHAIDARTRRLEHPSRFNKKTRPVTPPRDRPTGRPSTASFQPTSPSAEAPSIPSLSSDADRGGFDRPRRTPARRDEPQEGVWFRLSVGRNQGADPRWLVPLICKRGGVQKNDIGRIDVLTHETRFLIAESIAPRFASLAAQSSGKGSDASIVIEPMRETPVSFPRRPPRRPASSPARTMDRPAASAEKPRAPKGASGRFDRAPSTAPAARPSDRFDPIWKSRRVSAERPSPGPGAGKAPGGKKRW
ncbi:MAG: DEAD/DEAH box helicase [Myxococcales bacterium]|jgi:ATP-dependent RNA helicase DeaD|nr:DEAD/DEAH box helicase [Myxococcales bacterium]